MPSSRWCITGLQTNTVSTIWRASIPPRRQTHRQLVQRRAHGLRHLDRAARVHHGVGDPAHQVLAEADLRVHDARGRQHRPVPEVRQMRGDGGRPHVDGQPVEPPLPEPRPDVDQPVMRVAVPLVDHHRDRPVPLAQHGLERLEHRQRRLHPLDLPLVAERGLQPFEIARGLVHVGLGHLDVVEPRGRVHDDGAGVHGLADDLLVHLALGRHVDHHVALDRRLAAEAAPLEHAALGLVALLDRVPGVQRAFGDRHAVLGELAVARRHLALGADAAPAADRIEIDAQLPRRREDRRSGRKAPALSGWREDHKMVAVICPASVAAGVTPFRGFPPASARKRRRLASKRPGRAGGSP
jgi:hypothetical protein